MKQQILTGISSKLAALGIPAQNGNGADITIDTEFLDAGWSTGSKKISYEASVFANEQENVIYMYEKTTEVGHGLSFGGSSDSSFQSGTTLFRKVKSVQYGLDGKAYEYTLDLGAIPKAVKETAKQAGWKFKIVLNKNKAMYPAGYAPATVPPIMEPPSQRLHPQTAGFCSNCGMQLIEGAKFCEKCGKPIGVNSQQETAMPPVTPAEPSQFQQPLQSQYNDPQGALYARSNEPAPKSKAGTLGLIGFILLGIVAVIFLSVGKSSTTGWLVSAAVLAGGLLLQRNLTKKGCLLSIVLWVVTAVILLLTIGLTVNLENNGDSVTTNPQNTQTSIKDDGSGNLVSVVENSGTAMNPNVDEINITDYFQKILDQVKKEWKGDARIISIRMDKSYEKSFNSLQDLKVDSNWRVIFYSLSTMNEAVVDLDNSKKNSQGVPVIKYQTEQAGALTMEDIKNKGLKIYEYNRPETAEIHRQVPENCLTGCTMKMSEILKALNERFKNEQDAQKGYYLTINGIKGPKLDIYWEKGSTKNRFFIDLDTKKSYDQQ